MTGRCLVSGLLAYGLQVSQDIADRSIDLVECAEQRQGAGVSQMGLDEPDSGYGFEIHLHFVNRVAEQIDVDDRCVAIEWVLPLNVLVEDHFGRFGRTLDVECVERTNYDKFSKSAVLGESVKFMKQPERVMIAPAPCFIRLTPLDDCLGTAMPRVSDISFQTSAV